METKKQLAELQQAMKKATNRRLFERYQAVYLYLKGYTMKETGQIIGRSRETVSSYVSSYKKEGIAGLTLGHSSGKPRRLKPEQEAALIKVVTTQTPLDVQISEQTHWTLALMIKYVEREWGYTYSLRGMSLLLKRLGLVYKRPRYILEKAYPETKPNKDEGKDQRQTCMEGK